MYLTCEKDDAQLVKVYSANFTPVFNLPTFASCLAIHTTNIISNIIIISSMLNLQYKIDKYFVMMRILV